MDEEQIDRREFAATQKVSGRASRELLESLAFHRKPRRGPMSDRIVNGVCTTCKGDAYLFYDAAGGHCWKCDVAAAEARAVRYEADSARLDWLEANRHAELVRCDWSEGKPDEFIVHNDQIDGDQFRTLGRGATVRAAIDAALAAERP